MNDVLTKEIKKHFRKHFSKKPFIPGESPVPVSGKVFDADELLSGVDSIMEGWWTEGTNAKEFEKEFASLFPIRYVTLVNSGSSANLTAFSALTSRVLGKRQLMPGDEVITVATGFPTTVNPIIQNRCIPVFVDNDLATYNASLSKIKKAYSNKTKAIMIAHTLGNPYEVAEVVSWAKEHELWVIEDCCDALGSTYNGKLVGTFGDIATFSFYPAHQITMGEGGAIITNNALLHRGIRQFRDWGRDCWCDTGKDNTCRKRFGWKMGDLPFGYDHKYIYSQIGYNLKLSDMQPAIGRAQLKKLKKFVKLRRENHAFYQKELKKFSQWLILPEHSPQADPSWFGYMITVRANAPFTRLQLVEFLEAHNIATRSLFAGNLVRHPAYLQTEKRIVGKLTNSDLIMNNGFWIGVFPGITKEMREYVVKTFEEFFDTII